MVSIFFLKLKRVLPIEVLKFKLSSICLWESFKRKSIYKRSLSMKVALLHFEFRGRMWIIAAIKTKTNHSHTRAAFVQHWAEEMESFDYISRNASGQRQIRDLTILFLLLNKTFIVFENNEKALFLRRNCNWGLFVFLLCKGVRPYLRRSQSWDFYGSFQTVWHLWSPPSSLRSE